LFTLGVVLITPYSTGLFVWYIYHTFVIVCAEFWLSFYPQIRPTIFPISFLFNTTRGEMKVRLCLKLFDFFLGEYSSVWPEICWVLSQIQSTFLCGISVKNYFWEIFLKFCEKPRLSSTKISGNLPYFLQFYYGFILRWKISKKITQVLSYIVFTQLGRHVHK